VIPYSNGYDASLLVIDLFLSGAVFLAEKRLAFEYEPELWRSRPYYVLCLNVYKVGINFLKLISRKKIEIEKQLPTKD